MLKSPFRFSAAILFALLAFASIPAFAQDAGQVLRLSVAFRTVKNNTLAQMSAEKRKEIEELEAKARAANGEKKYGEALKHFMHGLALMRNQRWTPADALAAALEFKADRLILDPADLIRLKVSQIFVLDEPLSGKLTGSLSLRQTKENQPETLKELKSLAEIEPDFTRPISFEIKVPDVADGAYQISLKLAPKDGEPLTKNINVRIARGLNAQANALKERVAQLKTDLQMRNQQSLLLLLPSIEYSASMIDLVNDGAIGLTGEIKNELAKASADLDQIAKGENPLRSKRGDIHWSYRSEVDGTLQPYRFYVPAGYSPNKDISKKWPLVVALHGMGGDENSFFNGYSNGEIKRIAEARGYLVACPKGRAPTSMYFGSAERDVLDVIQEIRREYAIDEDRIYLMGHSMGGYGTWSISVNHPDLFAAIAPIAGGGTPPVMMKLRAISHLSWMVIHGDKDPTVSVEESRRMVKNAQELGIEVKYHEVPGGDHNNVVAPAFKEIFDWFDAHKRRAKGEVKAAGSSQ